MTATVYVEGVSDKQALTLLLSPLISRKSQEGIAIQFFEAPSGDRKASVLQKVPTKAVNILRNRATDHVIALPDLYPPNKAFPHETVEELRSGIRDAFRRDAERKNLNGARLAKRVHVFCLKYDLEVLVLAAHEQLAKRLDVSEIKQQWILPVEDQNHDVPPKHVVESVFREHGQTYQETIDTPRILEAADYRQIASRCPQQFQPFVDLLTSLGG